MGAFIAAVLQNVIANGVCALISSGFQNGTTGRRPFELEPNYIVDLQNQARNFDLQLTVTLAALARKITVENPTAQDRLRSFISSPEMESMVRGIFASLLSQSEDSLKSLRDGFIAQYEINFSEFDLKSFPPASEFFDSITSGCERAIGLANSKGFFRTKPDTHIISDELAAISKYHAVRMDTNGPTVSLLREFEDRLRSQIHERHGDITPPHFDGAKRIPIDRLYVTPDIIEGPGRSQNEGAISLDAFSAISYRAVILGTPGAGKSTLAQKLSHDLSSPKGDRLFASRTVTPLLVVLRDYGIRRKSDNCSILKYIESSISANYQIPILSGAIERMLLTGRALVIFDGLDELLDTKYRQEITYDVECFCNLYPSTPVLVTSRLVGYEQAPLKKDLFKTFSLAPFSESKVTEYANKWFATDSDLTVEQQQKKAASFLSESTMVSDLRSNPLMLALMCNIYRGDNYIPRNRPEVYEKCAVMLFERWDKGRGILVSLPFEAHIAPAMKDLAFWIYSTPALQEGVSERQLVHRTTEYLTSWRFEDSIEAERAAREFVEFCRGRAWVFTDTGTQRDGEGLYQFTHRTFLEYFAASHLVRTHATPDKLYGTLGPRIKNTEWDMVAQVAFQLQHRNIEGGGDQLLELVLKDAAESKGGERTVLLSFASRCLQFVVPRPKIVREIATAVVNNLLESGINSAKNAEGRIRSIEVFSELLYAAVENQQTIGNVIQSILVDSINDDTNSIRAKIAGEIGFTIDFYVRHDEKNLAVEEWLKRLRQEIDQKCSGRKEALGKESIWISQDLLFRNRLKLKEFIERFGLPSFFISISSVMHTGTQWVSGAIFSLSRIPMEGGQADTIDSKLLLAELGEILRNQPMPWISTKSTERFEAPHSMLTRTQNAPSNLSPVAIFGALSTCCVLTELFPEASKSIFTNSLPHLLHVGNHILAILSARNKPEGRAIALDKLSQLDLHEVEVRILTDWINGSLDFVSIQRKNKA